MKKTLFVLLVVGCVVFSGVLAASAYQEGLGNAWGAGQNANFIKNTNADCTACHGNSAAAYKTGPHGDYAETTDKCGSCHDVHEALSTNKLLPATTVFGVCNSCHDLSFAGTGGNGPYGAIRAQGGTIYTQARHNVEGYNNTETAPPGLAKSYAATSGGLGNNGGDWLAADTTLTCSSCHTPHGNTIISPFVGERMRYSALAPSTYPTETTKILQDDVNGAPKGTYTVYGADWCGACHTKRHSGSKLYGQALNNHPVDQTNAEYGAPSMTTTNSTWGALVSWGATLPAAHQAGFSREATSGWKPLCQQCHEDFRNVEAAWSVTTTDGRGADNPDFGTFPHETVARSMTVESGDDLCLNCHPTVGLP